MAPRWPLWLTRAAFALVFCWNVLCAAQFITCPQDFTAAYQLSGVQGQVALRGLGVAFLMWNATYPAFIASPRRFPVLGWVILAQQLIGLVGEGIILAGLPAGFEVLAASITRFIAFDAAGLVIMTVAFALLRSRRPE